MLSLVTSCMCHNWRTNPQRWHIGMTLWPTELPGQGLKKLFNYSQNVRILPGKEGVKCRLGESPLHMALEAFDVNLKLFVLATGVFLWDKQGPSSKPIFPQDQHWQLSRGLPSSPHIPCDTKTLQDILDPNPKTCEPHKEREGSYSASVLYKAILVKLRKGINRFKVHHLFISSINPFNNPLTP